MNSFGENHNMSSKTRKQLHGPRPPPLTVSKSSTKIKKPLQSRSRSPVIIYLQSPKVINVRPEEFMGIVQRLTGNQAPSVAASSHSYSTSCVMVADQTMGMGISSECQQQMFDGGVEYGADQGFGIPPRPSNFASYPCFYLNVDQCKAV